MQSTHVIISGRVQGVSYRAWTVTTAKKFGLNGWVRNCSDGTVEAVFSGDKSSIEAMLEICYEGPAFASVTSVVSRVYDEPVETGFFQLETV